MKLQAVTTTGIYCRSDCSARPNPENVLSVPHAVSALARGFRPCLRCRPDQLPGFGLPDDPPTEVAKALALISDGYLNRHTTEQLAAAVGYSNRQLVRLFQDHLGATPDFVARSLRAHLARRLLDDSKLTITDVAFAAGFSSIRQMNRVVRELFGFSPSELRKKSRVAPLESSLDGGLRLRIPYAGPVAVPQLLNYLETRAIPGVESVDDATYRRTCVNCDAPAVVEIQGDSREGPRTLETTFHLASFGSLLELVGRVRNLFGLEVDSTVAEQQLKADPNLRPLVERCPGLRMPGAWDPFETSLRIIVGQQVSVAGASTVTGRIASRFGRAIQAPLPGDLNRLFPSAEDLAEQLDPERDDLSMPRRRAQTIATFAEAVASGELDLRERRTATEWAEALEPLPGIGPWTSQLIAARVGRDADAFPSSDLGLRKGAARLLNRKDLSAKELEQYAERWRPFRAFAAAYLWLAPMEAGKENPRSARPSKTPGKAVTHVV